jgi:hypothetical protein
MRQLVMTVRADRPKRFAIFFNVEPAGWTGFIPLGIHEA